jgi:hypothetical protein
MTAIELPHPAYRKTLSGNEAQSPPGSRNRTSQELAVVDQASEHTHRMQVHMLPPPSVSCTARMLAPPVARVVKLGGLELLT